MDALSLLARAYRERESGVLRVGSADDPTVVVLREGQITALGPRPAAPSAPSSPRPDDSVSLKLERILAEIGIRSSGSPPRTAPAPGASLRERLVAALAERGPALGFERDAPTPADAGTVVGATEPVILEAVRRLRDSGAVRAALGDLDRPLSPTTELAEERTLTLTEGYLLSRIDGQATARHVLELVPLDADDTERTLLGLLLTGRVEAGPASPRTEDDEMAPPAGDAPASPGAAAPPAGSEAAPEAAPYSAPSEPPAALPRAEAAPETTREREEILELFRSLNVKNHFEVLGVAPGCSDADVKRAYLALVKRFHPDVHRDARLAELHDVLEAIFIRIGEAWEVLGSARSRATYEARFRSGSPEVGGPRLSMAGPADGPGYVPPEETLLQAQLLFSQARYWDAIQVLEAAVPRMEPRRHMHRGRILLARAYAKNPNWVRRAEETLQDVVKEDPSNVDAVYELGLLYKAGGLAARAQAMFRRAVELRPDHRDAAAELGPGTSSAAGGSLLKRLFGRGKAS